MSAKKDQLVCYSGADYEELQKGRMYKVVKEYSVENYCEHTGCKDTSYYVDLSDAFGNIHFQVSAYCISSAQQVLEDTEGNIKLLYDKIYKLQQRISKEEVILKRLGKQT